MLFTVSKLVADVLLHLLCSFQDVLVTHMAQNVCRHAVTDVQLDRYLSYVTLSVANAHMDVQTIGVNFLAA